MNTKRVTTGFGHIDAMHLAHGLSGDGDRIPRRAVIIYDVELLKLKNK